MGPAFRSPTTALGDTALKPAFEPITVARKPLEGTAAGNWQEHGTGALNIDQCRVSAAGEQNPTIERRRGSTAHLSTRSATEAEANGKIESRTSPERYQQQRPAEALGRWPANLIHDVSAEVLAGVPGGIGAESGPEPRRFQPPHWPGLRMRAALAWC